MSNLVLDSLKDLDREGTSLVLTGIPSLNVSIKCGSLIIKLSLGTWEPFVQFILLASDIEANGLFGG